MPIRATLLLADSAQVADGKLYVLGGGWSIIGPEIGPTAIAMLFEVSWDLTNIEHHWRLDLVDMDDQPVQVPTPMGDQPLVLQGTFEVGRPPGSTPGTPLSVPLAISLGPIPLTPGQRYVWRLTVGDQSEDDWRLTFTTRPAPTS